MAAAIDKGYRNTHTYRIRSDKTDRGGAMTQLLE